MVLHFIKGHININQNNFKFVCKKTNLLLFPVHLCHFCPKTFHCLQFVNVEQESFNINTSVALVKVVSWIKTLFYYDGKIGWMVCSGSEARSKHIWRNQIYLEAFIFLHLFECMCVCMCVCDFSCSLDIHLKTEWEQTEQPPTQTYFSEKC